MIKKGVILIGMLLCVILIFPVIVKAQILEDCEEYVFMRGDANDDDTLDLSDAVTMLNVLFGRLELESCVDKLDANEDKRFDLSDPVFILNYLFNQGPEIENEFSEGVGSPIELYLPYTEDILENGEPYYEVTIDTLIPLIDLSEYSSPIVECTGYSKAVGDLRELEFLHTEWTEIGEEGEEEQIRGNDLSQENFGVYIDEENFNPWTGYRIRVVCSDYLGRDEEISFFVDVLPYEEGPEVIVDDVDDRKVQCNFEDLDEDRDNGAVWQDRCCYDPVLDEDGDRNLGNNGYYCMADPDNEGPEPPPDCERTLDQDFDAWVCCPNCNVAQGEEGGGAEEVEDTTSCEVLNAKVIISESDDAFNKINLNNPDGTPYEFFKEYSSGRRNFPISSEGSSSWRGLGPNEGWIKRTEGSTEQYLYHGGYGFIFAGIVSGNPDRCTQHQFVKTRFVREFKFINPLTGEMTDREVTMAHYISGHMFEEEDILNNRPLSEINNLATTKDIFSKQLMHPSNREEFNILTRRSCLLGINNLLCDDNYGQPHNKIVGDLKVRKDHINFKGDTLFLWYDNPGIRVPVSSIGGLSEGETNPWEKESGEISKKQLVRRYDNFYSIIENSRGTERIICSFGEYYSNNIEAAISYVNSGDRATKNRKFDLSGREFPNPHCNCKRQYFGFYFGDDPIEMELPEPRWIDTPWDDDSLDNFLPGVGQLCEDIDLIS